MAIFLDGIQEIEDNILEFKTIASGTLATSVAGGQFPSIPNEIPVPAKLYRNYAIVFKNNSGVSVSTINIQGVQKTANTPVPNNPINAVFNLRTFTLNTTTGFTATVDITSEEPNPFLIGPLKFTCNLSAVPTTNGTIDWALIGY